MLAPNVPLKNEYFQYQPHLISAGLPQAEGNALKVC